MTAPRISPVSLPCPGANIAAAAFATLPVIQTPRLLLRAPKVEDFALYAALCASTRARFLGGPLEEVDAWSDFTNYTAGWLLRGDGMFSIAHDGALAGFIFAGVEPGDEEIELGFILTAETEGRGVAFEASFAVLTHLWSIGAPSVVSYIDPRNARAIALAERLGGQADGTLDGARVYRYSADTDGSPEAYA